MRITLLLMGIGSHDKICVAFARELITVLFQAYACKIASCSFSFASYGTIKIDIRYFEQ